MRLAMNGMNNSATSKEPITVAMTVMGSTRMNLPGVPGSTARGKKAKTNVAVQPTIASAICRVPAKAA